MNKKVPFVSNTQDDMHCVPAVFRMLHRYFFDKDLSWEQIDNLMRVISGKGTWTFVGLTEFAKKGLKIIHIEPINYEKLYEEGPSYLNKVVGKETANYYLTKSNIESVIKYIPEYLKNVKQINRASSIKEILEYLNNNSLIGVEINSRILNNKSGFNLHYVLLYKFDGKHIFFHDPGLPPMERRKVTVEKFDKCFDFKGANKGITVFNKP